MSSSYSYSGIITSQQSGHIVNEQWRRKYPSGVSVAARGKGGELKLPHLEFAAFLLRIQSRFVLIYSTKLSRFARCIEMAGTRAGISCSRANIATRYPPVSVVMADEAANVSIYRARESRPAKLDVAFPANLTTCCSTNAFQPAAISRVNIPRKFEMGYRIRTNLIIITLV